MVRRPRRRRHYKCGLSHRTRRNRGLPDGTSSRPSCSGDWQARPGANGNVKAYIIPAEGIEADDDLKADIQEHVRTRLAAYEYPREIEFIDELPMTTTGKIMRRELRRRGNRKGEFEPMSKEIDYYYSHVSPWSYLGAARLHKIADAAGAKINFKPVNLGVIFPQSGGLPLGKRAPQRRAYRMMELKRWKAHLDVELNLEPKFFPANDTTANLMAVTAGLDGLDVALLSLVIMRKCWVEEKDVAQDSVLVEAADQCRLMARRSWPRAEKTRAGRL